MSIIIVKKKKACVNKAFDSIQYLFLGERNNKKTDEKNALNECGRMRTDISQIAITCSSVPVKAYVNNEDKTCPLLTTLT